MGCWRYRTIVFEYKKDGLLGEQFIDEEEMETTLNEAGRAGWELISATMVQDGLLTLLKQPDSKEVNQDDENENDEDERYRGGGEDLLPKMTCDKEPVSAFKENSGHGTGGSSNCFIGEIKID